MVETVGHLITKENACVCASIAIAYLVSFPLPKNFTDSPSIVLILGVFIFIFTISSRQTLHNFLFKRLFASLEAELRKINSKYNYNLKKEAREEIDKIDKYFHSHATSFSSLLITSMILTAWVLLQFFGIVPYKILTIQTLKIYSQYVITIIVLILIWLMRDDFKQIKEYMFVDYKRVYEKYG